MARLLSEETAQRLIRLLNSSGFDDVEKMNRAMMARWVMVRCDSITPIGDIGWKRQLFPATIIQTTATITYPPEESLTSDMIGAEVLLTVLGLDMKSVTPVAGRTYSGVLTGDIELDALGSQKGRPRVIAAGYATATDPDVITKHSQGLGWLAGLDSTRDCLMLSVLERNGACDCAPVTYDCVGNYCVDPRTGLGAYPTLADCLAVPCLESPPPLPLPPTYHCIGGFCVDPGDGTGIFSTLALCLANPCAPVAPPPAPPPPPPPPPLSGSQLGCPGSPPIPSGTTHASMGTSVDGSCNPEFVSGPGDPAVTTDLGAAGFTVSYNVGGYVFLLTCSAAGVWSATLTGGGRTINSRSPPNMICRFNSIQLGGVIFDLSVAAGDLCVGSIAVYGLFAP